MIKNVESNTRASLTTDHFPLEVTVQVKLGAGNKAHGPQRAPKRDFPAITNEGWRGLYDATRIINIAMGNAETVEAAWIALKAGTTKAMEENVPEQARRARRPWISQDTLELIEHRKALAAAGMARGARDIDKMVRASATEDKRLWVKRGLELKFWEPIKETTRKPQPKLVTLKNGDTAAGGGPGSSAPRRKSMRTTSGTYSGAPESAPQRTRQAGAKTP